MTTTAAAPARRDTSLAGRLRDRVFGRGDGSEIDEYHRWLPRVARWNHTASSLQAALTGSVKPSALFGEGWKVSRRFGPRVAARHGVGVARQYLDLCGLGMRYGLPAESYYKFSLYLDEERDRAGKWVNPFEAKQVMNALLRLVGARDARVLADKRAFFRYCRERGFPTVPIIAEVVDGEVRWYDETGEGRLPERDLFTKPVDGFDGNETGRWSYAGGGRYRGRDGRLLGADELLATVVEASRLVRGIKVRRTHPYLIQPSIRNHPELEGLTNGSLCTSRIVTARRPDGSVFVLTAALRMPVGDSPADNFAQGGIAAPVDVATGRLGRAARKLDVLIEQIDAHPDTGRTITGVQLPQWQEAVDLAIRVHHSFAELAFAGWDIVLQPEGPLVLEGNHNWCVELAQIPHRRPLGETEFPALFNHWMREGLARAGRR